jgi:hypothetical protein
VATPTGAVAAQALSDEGDNPGLTDRVGPPVSVREATADSDKRSRRRPNRTSGAGDDRIGQAEQAGCENFKGNDLGYQGGSGQLTMGCGKFFSKFSNKDLGFKI